jgi:2-desacetyl-2-hydroxyethyl bacteriochlorophyllide A dehydrogenase
VVVPSIDVYPLPDSLPLEESCVITDAVATSYHAVNDIANVKPGDTVAIYGASGGLGYICIQLASAIGAKVIGIGRKRWKLDRAKELGASEVISIDEVERVDQAVRRLTGGGVDISIDVTGVPVMIEAAFKSTRAGGKVVVVGFSFHRIQLDINRLMWLELTVRGCRTNRPVDLPKVIKLVESGVIDLSKVISHRFKLEEINQAYQMLDRGELIRGIIVL